ncbi:MAG: flavin reductase family protein [Deltaproteobacteria bacterium]|nr:flavin reductase family protein [Deltaproteobacteria bacterium]
MPMNPMELRRVMGHFATGVAIITTRDKEATPYGLTANALTSLSLNPPLVLICVDKNVQCYPCFEESRIFAINFLSEGQAEISRRFATKGIEKFSGIAWRLSDNGLAIIEGTMGYIECRLIQTIEGGDHTIYIGEGISAAASGERPLIFFKGNYHRLSSGE